MAKNPDHIYGNTAQGLCGVVLSGGENKWKKEVLTEAANHDCVYPAPLVSLFVKCLRPDLHSCDASSYCPINNTGCTVRTAKGDLDALRYNHKAP